MDARLALSLSALLLSVPVAAADPVDTDAARCLDVRAPPCGFILPTIDIIVEGELPCGGGRLIYADGPPDDCEPIMEDGASRTYDALFRWYWEMSEDGTYPKELNEDIEITFSGASTNPRWLKVDVTGEGMVDGKFIIDDAALMHPDNIRTEESSGTTTVWYWYERPITITFTREGSPQGDELDRIDSRQGVPAFFLKSKSTPSEPRFKEAFGVEEFRFNACTDPAIAADVDACAAWVEPAANKDEQAPGLAPLLGLLALLGMARLRRRD